MGKVIFGATFTLDQTVKKNTVPESGGQGLKQIDLEGTGVAQMRTFRGKEEGIQSASIMRFVDHVIFLQNVKSSCQT